MFEISIVRRKQMLQIIFCTDPFSLTLSFTQNSLSTIFSKQTPHPPIKFCLFVMTALSGSTSTHLEYFIGYRLFSTSISTSQVKTTAHLSFLLNFHLLQFKQKNNPANTCILFYDLLYVRIKIS